ncbi:prolyl-tRNA synthetase associated domain-containing protein [Maricaulis sp.]|uniref:prolyl-tRNA synthetase associated domain-containing protein n=1 Tax=Maricaulis sp. TaxID=1486257 RepID=UPI002B2671B6|nr:prolyl-tRNA synthetase associated domain-containing protein [Maricaulis sp.]
MMIGRTELLERFDALGIAHETRDHAPIFTVADGEDIKRSMPGGHTKNLFLNDKKGHLVLVSALGETAIPINKLHPVLGCGRLSFGKPDLLYGTLGVRPGSVSAFALVNDAAARVQFVLDAGLMRHERVNFHPLSNDATTAVASRDLIRFVRNTGHEPLIMDFSTLDISRASAE